MGIRLEQHAADDGSDASDRRFDLRSLLHPAQAYAHPDDVARDPDLTLNEKRSILASWASDACAVESAPALRSSPGSTPVTFDEVMDALRALDEAAREYGRPKPHYRKVLAMRHAGPAESRHRRQ